MSKRFYIDAGHRNNTSDFGATWCNRKESKDALDFAQLLACNLKALGAQVKLSRDNEKTCKGLSSRTKEANNWGADLYISIHRNASASHKGYGAETLVYSDFDLANQVQKVLVSIGKFKDRGVKVRRDLHVLKATKMKALLLEVGFIDFHSDNEKFDTYKLDLAKELAKALV